MYGRLCSNTPVTRRCLLSLISGNDFYRKKDWLLVTVLLMTRCCWRRRPDSCLGFSVRLCEWSLNELNKTKHCTQNVTQHLDCKPCFYFHSPHASLSVDHSKTADLGLCHFICVFAFNRFVFLLVLFLYARASFSLSSPESFQTDGHRPRLFQRCRKNGL